MPETAVVTLLFCDLVGSTELQQALGDDANDHVRRALLGALARAADAYGGTVVKSAGDGMMVAFRRSAADAVGCAAAMQRAAAQVEHDGAPLGLELRVGISSGEASYESGDWFGNPVIEAARLEAAARPGQILVSEVVRSIVGTRGGARFRDAGKRTFKGFARPVPVIEIAWRSDSDPQPVRRRRRLTRHRQRLIAGALLAVGAAIAATVTAIVVTRESGAEDDVVAGGLPLVADGYTPVLEGGACDPEWELGAEVTCEELVVPENREPPGTRQVRIAAITYPSRGETGNPPTVTLGGFEDDFEESDIRQYGDFVSFEIRGGTLSTPTLTCPEITDVQLAMLGVPVEESLVLQLDATRRCGERLAGEGHDLNKYGLNDIVLDLRDLVIANGWQRINLQANGEWSRIAILFAQRYPQVVRAVIIADALPFDAPGNTMVLHANGALSTYLDECRSDEGCALAFPELDEVPARQFTQLEEQPVTLEVEDPAGGPNVSVYVDGDITTYALVAALNSTEALPLIAPAIGTEGEAKLRTIASFLVELAPLDPTLPWGLYTSLRCEDVEPLLVRSNIDASVTAYPIFAALVRRYDVCSIWPTEADSVLDREIKVSPVPALILAGELSPWFPPAYAEAASEAFAEPQVIVFPHLGGAVISSGEKCILALRLEFLRNPRAQIDAETCMRSIPPIQFEGT